MMSTSWCKRHDYIPAGLHYSPKEWCLKKRKWNSIDSSPSREILKAYAIIPQSKSSLRCHWPELSHEASSAVGKTRKKSSLAFRPEYIEITPGFLLWVEKWDCDLEWAHYWFLHVMTVRKWIWAGKASSTSSGIWPKLPRADQFYVHMDLLHEGFHWEFDAQAPV